MASSGEQLAALVDTLMKSGGSWSTVVLQYGRRELEENQTYPRICWVPIGGNIDQTSYVGGRPGTGDTRAKQLRSAGLQHDVFIHNEDFEDTEDLWKAFVAAVVTEGLGSVEMGEFEWITETQAADFAVDGYMIRQRFTALIPISDSDIGTVEVTGQSHTGTFQGHAGGGDVDVC